jgi:hypothetical protein
MIGALQWMVTIGQFDILTAAMSMSSSGLHHESGI